MGIKTVLGLAALLVLARMSVFTVDRSEFAYVTQFGRHVATYDGADDEQAGLHFRWPWPVQSVQRVDRRLQELDLPAVELLTFDPRGRGSADKTLAIDAYVVWHVPDAEAVERFIAAVGTTDRAREILRDRVKGRLGAVIPRTQLRDLISDEPEHVDKQRERLRSALMEGITETEDGIEVVDVRIRRINYPPSVRAAIFERIISERNRKVAYYQTKGRTDADNIKSASEAWVSIFLAEVRARNEELRGQADAEADRILNDAVRLDPAYYAELKQREVGEAALDGKKKVWSTRLFSLIFPQLGKQSSAPAATAGEIKKQDAKPGGGGP
jgi:membrane protease subunit HflC